ncbi:MAG: zinc ribbon domain-containing protein [Methanomicrobium sp.]|nr:zinc ribbon domain-containing protein [Methanomicrobium sp.]
MVGDNICDKCGGKNPNDAQFCIYCGNNLDTIRLNQRSNGLFCRNCGSRNRTGVLFCSNCGKKLNEINHSPDNSQNLSRRNNILALLAVPVGLLVAGGLLSGNPNSFLYLIIAAICGFVLYILQDKT